MSINAISSVSLYEYYYKINKDEQEKKESPLADEMRKYGLVPTDNETINVALLRKAKENKEKQNQTSNEVPYQDRPWADLMYQLNIDFNPDPKDDIDDIKEELAILMKGMDDEELSQEIADLENHVENLYINFQNNYSTSFNPSSSLSAQMNNLSMLNRASLL